MPAPPTTGIKTPGAEGGGVFASILAAALILGVLQASHPARSAPQRPAKANIAETARQRAMDRDESRAQAKTLAGDIARLRDQLIALGAAEAAGEKRVGDKGARLAALNAAEAALADRMGRNKVELSRLLGALQLYRSDPPPALLISPKSAVDAVNAAILIRAITPELEARARAFADEARQLQTLRRQVVLATGDVLSAESDVADRRSELKALIAEKMRLEKTLSARADLAAADVRRLSAQAKALGVVVQGLGPTGDLGDDAASLRLTSPASGAPVRRYHDPWPGRARSLGWSWRLAAGSVVLSPADGQVDYAGPLKGWGLVLILRLSGGYHLVLAGLGATDARIGAAVTAGKPIGRMATATGGGEDRDSPAQELYLELRRGETPVDPAPWLARTTARRDD